MSSTLSTGKGHVNEAFESDEKGKSERSSSISSSEDEPVERTKWGNSVEFLLSCISMSVGLGNVWRFPFVAFDNGGGAFLIPYLIILILIGRPLYFLEMVLGQFSSSGSVKVWSVVPLAKGVGYGQAIATWCVSTYYSYLMALSLFYFFCSFENPLPWSYCNPDWANNDTCYDAAQNFTGVNLTGKSSSSEVFFNDYVLKKIDNIDSGIGPIDWRLCLCLLLAWILIFGVLIKGVASSGKVAYFTALFPYVVLITLLIRGCTLPGAGDGILYFINPQWEKIGDADVWYAAVTQCFFSLSAGFGAVTTYASYNPFRHRIYRDSTIVSLTDTGTSILAGVTIFSILGNLAYETGQLDDIGAVVKGGPGLAFISYPEAISKFDAVPQLFAVLFFLMLITLAIGSIMGQTGVIVTIICDQNPHWKRWVVTTVVCSATFLVSLIYVTPGGLYMLDLVDYFGAGFVVYVMVITLTTCICWIYGLEQIVKDIRFMLGFGVGIYWKLTWGIVLPLGLLVIFVYAMVVYQPLVTDNLQPHPVEAIVAGWILAAIAILQIPGWGLWVVHKQSGSSWIEKFQACLKPTSEWGPANVKIKREWIQYNERPVFFTWIPKIFIRAKSGNAVPSVTVVVNEGNVIINNQ